MGEKKAGNLPRTKIEPLATFKTPMFKSWPRMKAVPLTATTLKSIGGRVIDTILPPMGLFPGLDPQLGWADVTFIDDPCCAACGFPFEFDMGDDALCGRCTSKRPRYRSARSAFAYNDASRSVVLAFKHGGRTEALSMFARQMRRAGRDGLSKADVIIPVPLHYSRLTQRRYNQSAILAGAIAKLCRLPVDTHSLTRARATKTQGGLSYSGRRRNVRGAFRLSPKASVGGKTVVLIDDVFTTGATLEACTQCLYKGGAKSVHALTLARVVKGAALPT
ncbi:ComF family protein [Fretibacter rubidus]|uniref:ComF family protein n=1 Tax=Fretibacter rubidus TaxID=570162 RepID=UPI00352A4DBD